MLGYCFKIFLENCVFLTIALLVQEDVDCCDIINEGKYADKDDIIREE